MMKNINEDKAHFFVEADYQRTVVPSTQTLQASILESAKRAPQLSTSEKSPAVSAASTRKFFFWPPSFLQSTALATFMLIFSVGLLFIGAGDQTQRINMDQKLAIEAFSEDDLDWQELMLIDNELLFAQL